MENNITQDRVIKALVNTLETNISHGKSIDTVLADLKKSGFNETGPLKRNPAFCCVKHENPEALSKVLENFPWLLAPKNAETLFTNLTNHVTPENVDGRVAMWKCAKQYISPRAIDTVHLTRYITNDNPESIKMFDAIVKDLNLLKVCRSNKTLLEIICGEGREKLEPLQSHLDCVRALKVPKLNKKIEELSGPLAQIRDMGSNKGAYGDSILELSRTGVGWITEDGCYISAPYYSHVSSIVDKTPPDHPVQLWLKPRSEALKEYIDEETTAYFDAVPEGEHPEAHNIEIWADDQQSQFRQMMGIFITERGWVRVAYNDKGLRVEGTQEAIKKYDRSINQLADICGLNSPSRKPALITSTVYKPSNPVWSLPANVTNPNEQEEDMDI